VKSYEIAHSVISVSASRKGFLRQMKVRLSQPELAGDLLAFLRRMQCEGRVEKGGTLAVEVPEAPRQDQAWLELDLYLKAWLASHPDVELQLLDSSPRGFEGNSQAGD